MNENEWVNKANAKMWLWKQDLGGLKKQGMIFVFVIHRKPATLTSGHHCPEILQLSWHFQGNV